MAFVMSGDRELWQHYILQDGDYTVDRGAMLGKGNCGVVYKGTFKKVTRRNPKPPITVAIKEALGKLDFKHDLSEITILANFDHPCVMFMYGCRFPHDGQPMTIVMPLMKTTLDKVVKDERDGKPTPGWDGLAKSKCVFGIAAGLAYAHKQGVVHRDLKFDNIFLHDDMEPCIGDFGVAKLFRTLEETEIGNPKHKAPEVMNGEVYTTKADIYAYAILLYEMFAEADQLGDGRPCPRNIFQQYARIIKGARWQKVDAIPEFYWDLITTCWTGERDKRPSALQICQHLRDNREKYAFDKSREALEKLKEYEDRVMYGLVDDADDSSWTEEEDDGGW